MPKVFLPNHDLFTESEYLGIMMMVFQQELDFKNVLEALEYHRENERFIKASYPTFVSEECKLLSLAMERLPGLSFLDLEDWMDCVAQTTK